MKHVELSEEIVDLPSAPAGHFRQILSFRVGLLVVVLVAAVLRLWAITFGVPLVTHPDEPNILEPALAMVHNHDPNPHFLSTPASFSTSRRGWLPWSTCLSELSR